MRRRIAFIDYFATHYRKRLYEELARRMEVDFYFFADEREHFWNSRIPLVQAGDFRRVERRRFRIAGEPIMPGLLADINARRYDAVIKSLNGKVMLPLVYGASRARGVPFVLWTTWRTPPGACGRGAGGRAGSALRRGPRRLRTPATVARIAGSALHRPTGTAVREVPDRATAKRPVQELIDELLASAGRVALEAGCGSASHLRLDGLGRLVGIDISAIQLERNQGLDERVQGDLETYRFAADSFDLIIIWDVLEHLNRPVVALDNLVAAARPGALLVVAVPNLQSLKGLAAKVTPQWVHTATVRRAYPYWPRDQEDVGPFPTKLRPAITAGRLRVYAETRGLRVREIVVYESDFQRRVRRLLRLEGRRWEMLRRTVAVASSRRLTASGSELLILLEVPSAAYGRS